jgi:hypothetical protein
MSVTAELSKDAVEAIVKHGFDLVSFSGMCVCGIFSLIVLIWKPSPLLKWQWALFGGFLFFLFLLPAPILHDLFTELRDERKETRSRRLVRQKIENRLKHLTPPEKQLLDRYILFHGSAQQIDVPHWPTAIGLERDGILYNAGPELEIMGFRTYNIEHLAFEVLQIGSSR